MKTERKEKKEIVIEEECIYKGFVIFKCSKYTHGIITYRVMFSNIDVGYYGSIASAKRAITKRTKKNNLNNQNK